MFEVTSPHTSLLRLGLATDQSVVFWSKASSDKGTSDLQKEAIEQSWFGSLSSARTKYLVTQFQKRFPYQARQLLEFSPRKEPHQNKLVCHWHLQLTDPIYRAFTTDFLISQWSRVEATVGLDQVANWVAKHSLASNWQSNTIRRLASGLLSAASEAGLCQGTSKSERSLRLPNVVREDIDYLKQLLSLASASGELPKYLMSVGQSLSGPQENSQ